MKRPPQHAKPRTVGLPVAICVGAAGFVMGLIATPVFQAVFN